MSSWLAAIGQNPLISGIASLCGILGLFITVFLTFKAENINKTLKKMNTAKGFNRDRESFQRAFEGYRLSIVEDENCSRRLISDIESMLQQYKYKFREVFTFRDRLLIWRFGLELKKDSSKTDFQRVSSYLAELAGRLSKKEDVNIG